MTDIYGNSTKGNVIGPSSSTDNAIARYDLLTGKIIQDSGVLIDDSDNLTGVGTINGINLSLTADPKLVGTGVLSGGILSINADDTKYDISDGSGEVVNPSTGTLTSVSWTGLTAQSTTYSGILTYVSITSAGAVSYSTTKPTNSNIRDEIFLGVLVHVNATNIVAVNNEQMTLLNTQNQIRDISEAIGFMNVSGNLMASAGSVLTITKSAGVLFKFGANYENDIKDPHNISLSAIDTSASGTFQYRMRDGTSSALTLTDIIPNIKDDGTAYPGTTHASGRYGVQRVYSFTSNALKIQPSQDDYKSMAQAIASINDGNFIIEPSIAENGILIGYIITVGNTTDLSDTDDAQFLSAGKFGNTASNVTGGTQDLQSAYDNCIGTADILLNSTLGKFNIQSHSDSALEVALRIKNNTGTTVADITSAGDIISNSLYTDAQITCSTYLDVGTLLKADDLDSLTATTLLIGKSTATKVEIADTGIITEIQGNLDALQGIDVTGNITCSGTITTDDLDSLTATTLLIGKATATKVEIADTGITTDIQGPLVANEGFNCTGTVTATSGLISDAVDAETATQMIIGGVTAAAIKIADVNIITEISGPLEAMEEVILRNAVGIGDINFESSNGTVAVPTVLTQNDDLGNINFKGWDGSAYNIGAQIQIDADEIWSGSARGTEIRLKTNANGESYVNGLTRLRIDSAGDVLITENLYVTGDINPSVNITSTLGSDALRFSTSYLGDLNITNESAVASTSSAEISAIRFDGYGTAYATGASIRAVASEIWSGSANGTELIFSTNANGANNGNGTERMKIDSTGDIVIAGIIKSDGVASHNYMLGNLSLGKTTNFAKLYLFNNISDNATGILLEQDATGSGTITTSTALTVRTDTNDTVTITNGYNIEVKTPLTAVGSAITVNFGIRLQSMNTAQVGTSYGIYSSGASDRNAFLGNLGVGAINTGAAGTLSTSSKITCGGNLFISTIKSGATQVASTAAAGEVWKTASHATLPDNVLMIGV